MPEDMSEYMPEDMSDRMPEDMSEYMPEDMSDRMPEDMSDRVPEDMPDRVPEDMPDRMPEDLPDRMPEDMPEDMPDHMPEDMPDRMSNRMSEDMSDRMPEDLPVRKCINVMVGITRSKVIFFPLSRSLIWRLFPQTSNCSKPASWAPFQISGVHLVSNPGISWLVQAGTYHFPCPGNFQPAANAQRPQGHENQQVPLLPPPYGPCLCR